MLKKVAFAAIAFSFAAAAISASPASAGRGSSKDIHYVERLLDDEARGGPQVEGSISGGTARHRVCRNMRTRVTDPYTGRRRTVYRKTCWFD